MLRYRFWVAQVGFGCGRNGESALFDHGALMQIHRLLFSFHELRYFTIANFIRFRKIDKSQSDTGYSANLADS